MKNTTYTIQYWNGKEAEWKGAGLHAFTTREDAKKHLDAQVRMTMGMVEFRITECYGS